MRLHTAPVQSPLWFWPWPAWTTAFALISGLYLVILAVYRLYLSPLAKYPGPKLAALTQWVETYHELKGDGGRFFYKIDEWHDKYGPAVRISPHEVHIRDVELYESFYSSSYVAERRSVLRNRFGTPQSAHFTVGHALHKQRRAAMNPFFSKRKIAASSGIIQRAMDRVCTIVEEQYASTGRALNIDAMWGCFASDMIAEYALGAQYGFVDGEGFECTFVEGMSQLLEPLHAVTQFPWLMPILMRLPDWLNVALQPAMRPVLNFKADIARSVRSLQSAAQSPPAAPGKTDSGTSVLNVIMESTLPPSELQPDRLQQEATGVVGAGVETVSRTLSVATYHILASVPILTRLTAELEATTRDAAQAPSLDALMQLPFLTSCVNETLRIGLATTQRSPRVFRGPTPSLHGVPLPPDCALSMSIRDVHFDPSIFPAPDEFRPERWLPAPASRGGGGPVLAAAPSGRPLTRYLVAYAHGPRNCLGAHLANAEVYIGLARLVGRFGRRMRLAEGVGRESVDFWMDRFVPRVRPGAGPVRVTVAGKRPGGIPDIGSGWL